MPTIFAAVPEDAGMKNRLSFAESAGRSEIHRKQAAELPLAHIAYALQKVPLVLR